MKAIFYKSFLDELLKENNIVLKHFSLGKNATTDKLDRDFRKRNNPVYDLGLIWEPKEKLMRLSLLFKSEELISGYNIIYIHYSLFDQKNEKENIAFVLVEEDFTEIKLNQQRNFIDIHIPTPEVVSNIITELPEYNSDTEFLEGAGITVGENLFRLQPTNNKEVIVSRDSYYKYISSTLTSKKIIGDNSINTGLDDYGKNISAIRYRKIYKENSFTLGVFDETNYINISDEIKTKYNLPREITYGDILTFESDKGVYKTVKLTGSIKYDLYYIGEYGPVFLYEGSDEITGIDGVVIENIQKGNGFVYDIDNLLYNINYYTPEEIDAEDPLENPYGIFQLRLNYLDLEDNIQTIYSNKLRLIQGGYYGYFSVISRDTDYFYPKDDAAMYLFSGKKGERKTFTLRIKSAIFSEYWESNDIEKVRSKISFKFENDYFEKELKKLFDFSFTIDKLEDLEDVFEINVEILSLKNNSDEEHWLPYCDPDGDGILTSELSLIKLSVDLDTSVDLYYERFYCAEGCLQNRIVVIDFNKASESSLNLAKINQTTGLTYRNDETEKELIITEEEDDQDDKELGNVPFYWKVLSSPEELSIISSSNKTIKAGEGEYFDNVNNYFKGVSTAEEPIHNTFKLDFEYDKFLGTFKLPDSLTLIKLTKEEFDSDLSTLENSWENYLTHSITRIPIRKEGIRPYIKIEGAELNSSGTESILKLNTNPIRVQKVKITYNANLTAKINYEKDEFSDNNAYLFWDPASGEEVEELKINYLSEIEETSYIYIVIKEVGERSSNLKDATITFHYTTPGSFDQDEITVNDYNNLPTSIELEEEIKDKSTYNIEFLEFIFNETPGLGKGIGFVQKELSGYYNERGNWVSPTLEPLNFNSNIPDKSKVTLGDLFVPYTDEPAFECHFTSSTSIDLDIKNKMQDYRLESDIVFETNENGDYEYKYHILRYYNLLPKSSMVNFPADSQDITLTIKPYCYNEGESFDAVILRIWSQRISNELIISANEELKGLKKTPNIAAATLIYSDLDEAEAYLPSTLDGNHKITVGWVGYKTANNDESKNQYDGDNNLISASVSRSLVEKYTGETEDFYTIAEEYPKDNNRLKQIVNLYNANLNTLNNLDFLRVTGDVEGWANNAIVIRKPVDRSIGEYLAGYLFLIENNRSLKFLLDSKENSVAIFHNKFKYNNQIYYFNWYDESGYNNGDNVITGTNGTPGEDMYVYRLGRDELTGIIQIRNTDKFDVDKEIDSINVAHLSGDYKVDIKNGNDKVYVVRSVENNQSVLIDITNECRISYNRNDIPALEKYDNWYRVTVNHNGNIIVGSKTLNFDVEKFLATVKYEDTERGLSFSKAELNLSNYQKVIYTSHHYYDISHDDNNSYFCIWDDIEVEQHPTKNLHYTKIDDSSNPPALLYYSDHSYLRYETGDYIGTRKQYYGSENSNYVFGFNRVRLVQESSVEGSRTDRKNGRKISYRVSTISSGETPLSKKNDSLKGWLDEFSINSDGSFFNEVGINNLYQTSTSFEWVTLEDLYNDEIISSVMQQPSWYVNSTEYVSKVTTFNFNYSHYEYPKDTDLTVKFGSIIKINEIPQDKRGNLKLLKFIVKGRPSGVTPEVDWDYDKKLFDRIGNNYKDAVLLELPNLIEERGCMLLPIVFKSTGDSINPTGWIAGLVVRAVWWSVENVPNGGWAETIKSKNLDNILNPPEDMTSSDWFFKENQSTTHELTVWLGNNSYNSPLPHINKMDYNDDTIISSIPGYEPENLYLTQYSGYSCLDGEKYYYPFYRNNQIVTESIICATTNRPSDDMGNLDGYINPNTGEKWYIHDTEINYVTRTYRIKYDVDSGSLGSFTETQEGGDPATYSGFFFKTTDSILKRYQNGDLNLCINCGTYENVKCFLQYRALFDPYYCLYKLNTVISQNQINYNVYILINNSSVKKSYTYEEYKQDGSWRNPSSYFRYSRFFFIKREDEESTESKYFDLFGTLLNYNSFKDGNSSIDNLVDTGDTETRTLLVKGYTYLVSKNSTEYFTYYTRNPYIFNSTESLYYSNPSCKDSDRVDNQNIPLITEIDKTSVHAINFYKVGSVINGLTESSSYPESGIGCPKRLIGGSSYIVMIKQFDEDGNDVSKFSWYKSAVNIGGEPTSASKLVLIYDTQIPNNGFFLQEGQIINLNGPFTFSSLYYKVTNSDYYVYVGNSDLPTVIDSQGNITPAEEVYFNIWKELINGTSEYTDIEADNIGVCFRFDNENLNSRPRTKMMYGVSKGLSEDVQTLYHIDRIVDGSRSNTCYTDYAVTIEPNANVTAELYKTIYNNGWSRKLISTGKTVTFANTSNSDFPNKEMRLFRYKYTSGLSQDLFLPLPEGVTKDDINIDNFLGGEEKELLVSLKNPTMKITVPNYSFNSVGGELRRDITITNGYTVALSDILLPSGVRAELVYKNGEPNDEYWSSYIGYEKRELKLVVDDRYPNHNIIDGIPEDLDKITYNLGEDSEYYTKFVSRNNLEVDLKNPEYQLSIGGLNYSIYLKCNNQSYEFIEDNNTLYLDPISDITTEISFESYVKNLLTSSIEDNGLRVVKEEDSGNVIKSIRKDGNNYYLTLYRNKTKFDKTCTLKFTCLKDSNTTTLSIVITQKSIVDSLDISYDLDVPNNPLPVSDNIEYLADGTLVYKGINIENRDKNNGILYIRTNMLNDIVDNTKLTLKEKKDKIYEEFRITVMGIPVFYEVSVVNSSKGDLFYSGEKDSVTFDSVYKTYKLVNVSTLPNIVQVVQSNTSTTTLFSMINNLSLNKLFSSKRGYFLVKFNKCSAEGTTIQPVNTVTGNTEWEDTVTHVRPSGYTYTKYKEDRNPSIVFYEDSVFMNLVHGTELSSGMFSNIPLSYISVSTYDQFGQVIYENVENVQISNVLMLKPEGDTGEFQPILQGVLKDVDFNLAPNNIVLGSRTYEIPSDSAKLYWLLRYTTTTSGNYVLRNTINLEYRNRSYNYPFKCKLEVYYLLKDN